MDWTTTIHGEGFGNPTSHRWVTVKSWKSFKDLFENGTTLEGVTYCESPTLLLDLLDDREWGFQSVDLLIGDRDEFRSEVNDLPVARDLMERYRQGSLTIRLKNRKVVHSKLYRITRPDETVRLVAGSANLSYNSWRSQTNSLVVYETETGSQFDSKFRDWIHDHWEQYGKTVFLENLVDRLEDVDDEDDREELLQLWIDEGTMERSERAEVHTSISTEMEEMGQEVRARVSVVDDPDATDRSVEPNGTTTEAKAVKDADGEPIQQATTPERTVRISTQNFNPDGYAAELTDRLRRRGATASSDTLALPVETYTDYLHERYNEWQMWIDEEATSVHLQIGEEHRVFPGSAAPKPDRLDGALANVEHYIETVDRWGETNLQEATKAHMYEGILYALWTPFANLYARRFHGQSTLDKTLPYLYIHGDSDAGKDQFTTFLLQLLSDGLVEGGADGDAVGKDEIRVLREIDTTFPFVVSDISRQKIERIDTLRNFWKDSWQPDHGTDYPAIIFTSNDTRPNEWFRNRAKMLHFPVVFPSRPGDENFLSAQEDLNSITAERNPLFSFVAHRMLSERPYEDPDQTIGDVRRMVADFYEIAGRHPPSYFPAEEPAEKRYNVGKRLWENLYQRDDVSFTEREEEGHLLAEFDLEEYEIHKYRKVLPKQMRPEKSGRMIIIKNPGAFLDWVDFDIHGGPTLLQRISPMHR